MTELQLVTPLAGHYARLRPPYQSDYAWLYDLFTAPQNIVRWRLRGATPSPENFARFLWDSVLAQFVIEDQNGKSIGLVTAYQANFVNRFAYIAVVVDDESRDTGCALEATGLFVEYLFQNWEFRKIYIETLEMNYRQFFSGARRVFEVEGRLKDHEYLGGAYQDFLILAITRESWADHAERFRRVFGSVEPDQTAPSTGGAQIPSTGEEPI